MWLSNRVIWTRTIIHNWKIKITHIPRLFVKIVKLFNKMYMCNRAQCRNETTLLSQCGKMKSLLLPKKYFAKSTARIWYLVISLVKMLLSRNLCPKKKCEYITFRFYHFMHWYIGLSQKSVNSWFSLIGKTFWNFHSVYMCIIAQYCVKKWKIYSRWKKKK